MSIDAATLAVALAKGFGGGVSAGIAELLVNSISDARARYEASPAAGTETPLEQKRKALIDRLSSLQTNAITSIVDDALLQRVVSLIYKNLLDVYAANNEQRLHHIGIEVGQLEGLLQKYQQVLNNRRRARTLAVAASIVALGGLFLVIVFAGKLGLQEDTVTPLLNIPLPILLWSAVGSFAAILYRFNRSADYGTIDPIQWLITRPVTGTLMGVIAYFVVKVGLITVAPAEAGAREVELGNKELMWLVAFAAAFSDRFSDSILRNLIGSLGGPKDQELVTVTAPSSTGSKSGLASLIDHLKPFSREPEKPAQPKPEEDPAVAEKPDAAAPASAKVQGKTGGEVVTLERKPTEPNLPVVVEPAPRSENDKTKKTEPRAKDDSQKKPDEDGN